MSHAHLKHHIKKLDGFSIVQKAEDAWGVYGLKDGFLQDDAVFEMIIKRTFRDMFVPRQRSQWTIFIRSENVDCYEIRKERALNPLTNRVVCSLVEVGASGKLSLTGFVREGGFLGKARWAVESPTQEVRMVLQDAKRKVGRNLDKPRAINVFIGDDRSVNGDLAIRASFTVEGGNVECTDFGEVNGSEGRILVILSAMAIIQH